MHKPPRLILVDLDGTLLGADGHVSQRNAATLRRAAEAGARVVVATGRPERLLGPIRTGLPLSTVLCCNGAVVLDLSSRAVLASRLLDGALFASAVERMRADGLEFAVGIEGLPAIGLRAEPSFRPGSDIPRVDLPDIAKAEVAKALVRADVEQFDAVWRALESGFSDTLTITRSGIDGLIEISAAGVSKGTVIDELAKEWGIAPSEAIAFGDMPNDLAMLRWAGWSVAMGNGEPEVKLAASEVGADHNDDGVSVVLERWF